jgi:hypothetical protein
MNVFEYIYDRMPEGGIKEYGIIYYFHQTGKGRTQKKA